MHLNTPNKKLFLLGSLDALGSLGDLGNLGNLGILDTLGSLDILEVHNKVQDWGSSITRLSLLYIFDPHHTKEQGLEKR